MRIVDTHMHIGVSKSSGHRTTERELIHAMETYGVTHGLVMPQPTLEDVREVHKRIYALSQQSGGKISGIASIDPWLSEDDYRQQFVTCMEDYRFVAIKLHPMGHNISPLASQCDKVYQLANQYHVPVIVHTGLGAPNALPSLLIEPAKRYPDVTFVLAHAGFAIYTSEAIVAAKCCDNIVLEPSWCPTFSVSSMISQIGIERIVFGSDHMENIPVELAKYHAIRLSDTQLEHIFDINPARVFQLTL